jgi:hypothetical protein
MRGQHSMSEMVYRCISGAQVGDDGVCVEHGETACVIGVRVPAARDDYGSRPSDPQRETATSTSSRRRD